jgi:hypothetical protein
MQLIKTNSPHELGEVLQAAGIDISRWGTECKSLEELWQETHYGDCHLVQAEDGKIYRRVRVVVVTIHYQHQVLVEHTQSHNITGEVRHRKLAGSLIEKLMLDESPEEGALRLLAEEMDLHAHNKDLGAFEQGMVNRQSESYPGLATEYHLYRTHTQMPVALYQPEYQAEFEPWTTVWKWISEDQGSTYFSAL